MVSEGLKDKLKGLFSRRESVPEVFDGRDDFETRDKQLRALRRQKRRQMDIVEKQQLRGSIQRFEIEKGKKDFVGDSGLFNSSRKVVRSKSRKQRFLF